MPYTNFKYIISGDLVGLTDVGDAKWIAHSLSFMMKRGMIFEWFLPQSNFAHLFFHVCV